MRTPGSVLPGAAATSFCPGVLKALFRQERSGQREAVGESAGPVEKAESRLCYEKILSSAFWAKALGVVLAL